MNSVIFQPHPRMYLNSTTDFNGGLTEASWSVPISFVPGGTADAIQYFNATGVHPDPHDAPWFVDVGSINNFQLGICWRGDQKKAYVIVPTGDASPSQSLYVCDEFFCGAEFIADGTSISFGSGQNHQVRWMVHVKDDGGLDALAVYFASDDQDNRGAAVCSFAGVLGTGAAFGYSQDISTGTTFRNEGIYGLRGDDRNGKGGNFFIMFRRDKYISGSFNEQTSAIHAFGTSDDLVTATHAASATSDLVFFGQPTFDFVSHRILYPELTYDITGDDYEPTSYKIKQITLTDSAGTWIHTNVTIADLITLDTPTWTDGDGQIHAVTVPRIAWHSSLSDKIYVLISMHDVVPTIHGADYVGLWQYDSDGTNPQRLTDFDPTAGWYGEVVLPVAPEAIALGPGTRAPWEL